MKKSFKSALALLLCFCVLFTFATTAIAAPTASADQDVASLSSGVALTDQPAQGGISTTPIRGTTFGTLLSRFVNLISEIVINDLILAFLRDIVPMSPAVGDYKSFDLDSYENFLAGTETFLDQPAENAVWSLGYGQRSVLPPDFGEKAYARGGMLPYALTTETFNDLKARTVVLDDGSGRGKVAFVGLDCVGIANSDVRKIRAAVADFARENNIVSINVSATHTHSGIDTQGVWTDLFGVIIHNMVASVTGFMKLRTGTDPYFMNNLVEQTAASIVEACENMTPGKLELSQKAVPGYLKDRTPPYALDDNLYKLEFRPFDSSKRPTIINTMGVHPEATSYDFETISSDFVYYWEEVLNIAGYNFVFLQGNVSTTTSVRQDSNDGLAKDSHESSLRYGHEMGYITLGMSLTEEECALLNDECGDLLGVNQYAGKEGHENYSVWYEDWEPVEKVEVTPILNIRLEQFTIASTNNIANAMSKVSLANNFYLYDRDTNKYYTVTELGYLELGKELKVFISPGELMGELLMGGPGLHGFEYDSLRSMYGENIIVCDLMNDAIGYVHADPNYVMVGMQYDAARDKYDSDTWCLLVSLGKNTGSILIGKFIDMVDSVR